MAEEDVQNAPIVEEQPQAENAEVAEQQQMSDKEFNFKALREQTKSLEQQVYQQNQLIAELKQQKESKQGLFSGDKEDILTKGEVEGAFSKYRSELMEEVERQIVSSKYPNAQELLTKYGNEIPPRMATALSKSKDLQAAMEAIKMTPSYIRDHAKEHKNVAKAIENANKPKSTLNAGSAGAVSKASRYASMTPAQRMAMQDRFIRGYGE